MPDKTKAVLLMILSSLSFAFMAAVVKSAENIPIFEKVLFRNLVSLVVAYFFVRFYGDKLFGKKENLRFLLIRSLMGILGVILFFYSIENMYLADSAMLSRLAPFFILLFAGSFLKEKIYKHQIIGIIIVFAASTLIIKPEFNLSMLPALAGLGSAMVAGAAYTMVRFLGSRENPSTIVFFFSLVSVIIMTPLTFINMKVPNAIETFYLICTGIFAAGGQFALTYAFKLANASELAVFNYSNIIFAALIGYFVWGELSDGYAMAGGTIIIFVSIAIYFLDRKK